MRGWCLFLIFDLRVAVAGVGGWGWGVLLWSGDDSPFPRVSSVHPQHLKHPAGPKGASAKVVSVFR